MKGTETERRGDIFTKWLITSFVLEAAAELCRTLLLIPVLGISAVWAWKDKSGKKNQWRGLWDVSNRKEVRREGCFINQRENVAVICQTSHPTNQPDWGSELQIWFKDVFFFFYKNICFFSFLSLSQVSKVMYSDFKHWGVIMMQRICENVCHSSLLLTGNRFSVFGF